MKYSDKLKDPRWQKKRLEILSRDNFTCRCCEDKESTLSVHHTYYEKNTEPWEYKNISLITLCDYCHKLWHHLYDGGAFSPEIIASMSDLYFKIDIESAKEEVINV